MPRLLSILFFFGLGIRGARAKWHLIPTAYPIASELYHPQEHDETATSASRLLDQRLRRIQAACGSLCNTRRPSFRGGVVGHQYNHTSAHIPCAWLMADGSGIDASSETRFPPRAPPMKWIDEFTMHSRYPLRRTGDRDYTNYTFEVLVEHKAQGKAMNGDANVTKGVTDGWSRQSVNNIAARAKAGTMFQRYHKLNKEVQSGLRFVNVTGHRVLVIGSQSPWVEALALAEGARHVWTLEYAKLTTDHPQLTTLTPPEFLARARNGYLPKFDTILTASSVEHSGLGRYNDGLNPWGDILAVARAWCAASAKARLIIAVPTHPDLDGMESRTSTAIEGTYFNRERVYGPVRYPYLTTNWRFEHRVNPKKNRPAWGQTVYVFKRHRPQATH